MAIRKMTKRGMLEPGRAWRMHGQLKCSGAGATMASAPLTNDATRV
jgi:hypothetical protein